MSTPNYFRLSRDQVALLIHVERAPRALLNMPVRVDLESEIDEEKALEALRLTVTRLPFCKIRLHELEDGSFEQYYSEEEPSGIELVDMSDKTAEEVDAYILEKAGSPLPNDYNDVQLYEAKLIRTPGGKHTLYFNGYHLIMDSVGLITVIIYFDKVYNALVNGTELPAPGIGPEKHIEKSWEYYESKRWFKDIEWWNAQFATEPHFSSMNPRGSVEYIEGKNYGKAQTFDQLGGKSMPIRIAAETVQIINDAAMKNNMSPQIYFALALRTWLSKMSGSDDVCFDTTGARRSTHVEKECGMTVAHQVTWRSDISRDLSFTDALKQLDISLKDMYRHIGVEMPFYIKPLNEKFALPDGCTYKTVVFTYQPYFTADAVGLKFSANHVDTGFAFYPLYLNLMPHDDSGDLWADYLFSYDYLDEENLKHFHEFMLKFIMAGIQTPDKTIRELTEETI